MSVYFISQTNFDYQELDLEVDDFIDHFPDTISDLDAQRFSYAGVQLADFWPNMEVSLRETEFGNNFLPDIGHWMHAALFLSPLAYRYIGELMKPYGELLPIKIEGECWWIFNCTTSAELLESKATDEVKFNAFSVEGKLLFKCTDARAQGIYCSNKFKDLVESYGLKGISFESSIERLGESNLIILN